MPWAGLPGGASGLARALLAWASGLPRGFGPAKALCSNVPGMHLGRSFRMEGSAQFFGYARVGY